MCPWYLGQTHQNIRYTSENHLMYVLEFWRPQNCTSLQDTMHEQAVMRWTETITTVYNAAPEGKRLRFKHEAQDCP